MSLFLLIFNLKFPPRFLTRVETCVSNFNFHLVFLPEWNFSSFMTVVTDQDYIKCSPDSLILLFLMHYEFCFTLLKLNHWTKKVKLTPFMMDSELQIGLRRIPKEDTHVIKSKQMKDVYFMANWKALSIYWWNFLFHPKNPRWQLPCDMINWMH